MFKNHPKGLFVLAASNMGERFGFYTMLAIFTLYLQDYFGWDKEHAFNLYGYFLFGIYFLPILGGIIADELIGYGKTIIIGSVIMAIGYGLLAQPTKDPIFVYISLSVIALGVGMFKGNIVVLVGNIYDKKKLDHLRDSAYNLFYGAINIGAFFAPYAASSIKNFVLESRGFSYNEAIPGIAHQLIETGTSDKLQLLQGIAKTNDPAQLLAYSQNYLDALASGYNWAFGLAAFSMIVSLIVYLGFRKHYQYADFRNRDQPASENIVLSKKQFRDRILALSLVFVIVIFFWMAYQQNGSTMTDFAKNYTNLNANKFVYSMFYLPCVLSIVATIAGLVFIFRKNLQWKTKIASVVATVGGISYLIYYSITAPENNKIDPEVFQAFNPLFIVFLTPLVIGYFASLNKKGKEPSAPKKIGIGMIITAIGFAILMVVSFNLPSVKELGRNTVDSSLAVSPYWLISSYWVITFAELFLSPMGLSFVSKVAPPGKKGIMQAGWLFAISIGNLIAGLIGSLYENWTLWHFFFMLVVVCLISAVIIFSIMKIINKASKS